MRGGRVRSARPGEESDFRAARLSLLALLVAGVLGDALIAAPGPSGDLIAVALLALLAWELVPPEMRRADSRATRTFLAAQVGAFVVAAFAIRMLAGTAEIAAFALFLVGVAALRRRSGHVDANLPSLQLTVLLFGAFLLLHDLVPHVHFALATAARALSAAAAALTGGSVSVGAGFLGLQLTVLFLLHALSLTLFAAEEVRSLRRLALTVVALLAANLAYAVAWTWLSQAPAVNDFAGLVQPFAAPFDYRLLLAVLLAVPMLVYRRRTPPRSGEATVLGTRTQPALVAATALLIAVSVLVQATGVPPAGGDDRVVLLDSIGNMRQDLPRHDEYGLGVVGQFGLLPVHLEARGYEVEIAEEVTAELLESTGTLVVLNLRRELGDTAERAVWEFVEEGGSLMVVGDHTGTEEIRDPSNSLLEPYGISLNFDSAIPLAEGWANGYARSPHPVLNGLRELEIQLGVGASLDIAPGVRPLVIGRAGFADAGNLDNVADGFLGDMRYAPGEQMGDVVLAAETRSGAGLVMVFGDTSFVQNLGISRSYRFVDTVFARLAASAGGGSGTSLSLSRPAWDDRPFAAPYAVIDASHFGKAHLGRSRDSIDGLVANLVRAGYPPFVMYEYSEEMVAAASVVVLPSPMVPYTAREIEVLDAFMDDGGLLLLTTGSEKPYGAHTLLEHFGYELGGAPLGRATAHWESQHIQFWSAWPLRYDAQTGAEVVAEAWEHPVMLYRAQGAGGSLVVADASFLLEKNLEAVASYSIDNIHFLRGFLGKYAGGGGTDP